MLESHDLLRLQREQFQHDKRNHSDIQCLHKNDRLKHYGLHFAKYVGRMARGVAETKSIDRTLIDTVLVSLSAANTLHQNLSKDVSLKSLTPTNDPLQIFADAAGRFADACEKIDHWPAAGSTDTELRCFDGTGGFKWKEGSSAASSSLRR